MVSFNDICFKEKGCLLILAINNISNDNEFPRSGF